MHTLLLTPPTSPLNATLSVPGSKSYTNRALLMAAQADGTSRLSSASISSDSVAMILALSKLGVVVHQRASALGSELIVAGRAGKFIPYHGLIDVGPAGTTMRFLAALCAGIPGCDITLSGTPHMHTRPIKELVDALKCLGADIEYHGDTGCPPLRIRCPAPLGAGTVIMDGSVSSQFISALLLTAPLNRSADLTIELSSPQISKSYIDMTLQGMRDFGVSITNDQYRSYKYQSTERFVAREYQVEGDASGASYLWGLAAISGGTVSVCNINPDSAQGDIKFPELLARMGCRVTRGERSITVTGPTKLQAIEADMSAMPDTAQTLAVIAACAEGTTTITGLSTLRVKETDRIAALHTELSKLGIKSEAGADYLVVHGGIPGAARIATYEDHRMAMSFAMLSAKIPGIEIEEPQVVDKSFPEFWETLRLTGIEIKSA